MSLTFEVSLSDNSLTKGRWRAAKTAEKMSKEYKGKWYYTIIKRKVSDRFHNQSMVMIADIVTVLSHFLSSWFAARRGFARKKNKFLRDEQNWVTRLSPNRPGDDRCRRSHNTKHSASCQIKEFWIRLGQWRGAFEIFACQKRICQPLVSEFFLEITEKIVLAIWQHTLTLIGPAVQTFPSLTK